MFGNCDVYIMTSAMRQSWRICEVSDSDGRRGMREESLGLVGECLLVNGLYGSRRRICRDLLVSIYIEVFTACIILACVCVHSSGI